MQNAKSPDQLCAENLRLVSWAANKFLGCGLEFDDLQAAGNLGLVKAAHAFDSARGFAFASFACACIRNEILMLLRHERPHLGLRHLEEILCCDSEGNDLFLSDAIADPAVSLEEQLEQADAASLALRRVDALPQAQRDVIRLRYGLDGGAPLLQIEVARRLGRSRTWVSRTHKAALEKLREGFNNAND
jgi:RNA polymerase sporulation-specific sigma factor